MRHALFAALLALSVPAFGKDAPPRPTSGPADAQTQINELREEVRQLAALVRELRAEVAAMRASPAGATAAPTDKDIQAATAKRRLLVGMTLADVRAVFGENGELLHKSALGEEWEWEVARSVDFTGEGKVEELGTQTIKCNFRNGRLVSFSKRPT